MQLNRFRIKRCVVIDNYVLYYKANEANKTIEIVRIVYGEMKPEEISYI